MIALQDTLPKQSTFEGDLEQNDVFATLERFSKLITPGWLEFLPSGLALRLHRGAVVGARGGEPLGTILVGQGILGESEFSEALSSLQANQSLGERLLLAPFSVPKSLIQDCLRQQIEGVIDRLQFEPQQRFKFYRAETPTGLYARLEVKEVVQRKATLDFAPSLPLEDVYRMALMPDESNIYLSLDQWRVCRLLTGRRTLRQVLERSGSDHDGYARAYKALEAVMARGLLELAAVSGLRTIFLRRKREILASYHPPAGMIANLFLKSLDGTRDARSIGDELKIEPDKIALIVTGLHRDQVVDVIQGQTELNRLIEDY
jgi:hypothetical protein